MKKGISFFFISCLITNVQLQAQESLDGFLSVSSSAAFQLNNEMGDFLQVPISLQGSSYDHEILTKIDLVTDVTDLEAIYYAADNFSGSEFLYHYSYFSMTTAYQFMEHQKFRIYTGWILGHRGLIDSTYDKANLFELGVMALARYDVSGDFGISMGLEFSLAPGSKKQSRFFQGGSYLELHFAPGGSLRRPYYGDFMVFSGFAMDSIQVRLNTISYQKIFLYPYLGMSIFY